MATLIANLESRRTAIGVELAALSTSAAGGLPNASGGGEQVDHVGYKDGLYRELKQIEESLARLRLDPAAGGGVIEVTSEGY